MNASLISTANEIGEIFGILCVVINYDEFIYARCIDITGLSLFCYCLLLFVVFCFDKYVLVLCPVVTHFTFLAATDPPYLARLLTPYCPSRVLRSSFSSNLLQVPRTNLTFGSRSFRAAAPMVWNSLPDSVRSSNTLNSFRHHLKTHYFQAAFNTP